MKGDLMGAYTNYVQDFPNRCKEILETFTYCAQKIKLEVTLLLTVTTPCIILPYERLQKGAHPSKDHEKFDKAKKTLDDKLKDTCGKSGLWSTPNAWRFKKLDRTELRDDPWQWGLDVGTESIVDKKAKYVLSILRNALAHGSIWTMKDPIETLVFVSLVQWKNNPECKGPFNTIQCSPKELGQFLKNWVKFLNELKIPADQCIDTGSFRD
jgi:hypothetical protein